MRLVKPDENDSENNCAGGECSKDATARVSAVDAGRLELELLVPRVAGPPGSFGGHAAAVFGLLLAVALEVVVGRGAGVGDLFAAVVRPRGT